MDERSPSPEWIEAANCLVTAAHQLSSAVHEANNLLQVIAGSAEMIQMTAGVPASVVQRSATIADHAHRISGLLVAVRDLSKCTPPSAGEITDLSALVKTALDLRRHALNRGQITVSVECSEGPIGVRASWRPAIQIVLNLLLNAERALAARPGAAIVIRACHDGDEVVLSVEDNGIGLGHVTAAPFLLREVPEAAPLLGLGLTASRTLAVREGGRLDISSSQTGTTAVLRLPAA